MFNLVFPIPLSIPGISFTDLVYLISIYIYKIHTKLSDVITHACHDLNDSVDIPTNV